MQNGFIGFKKYHKLLIPILGSIYRRLGGAIKA